MALRSWPAEWREYRDRVTGVRIRQLTNHIGHSNHLYFTNSGWWDGGRQLLIQSDREQGTNLFSIDLETGQVTQITEETEPADLQGAFLNPRRDEVYYWRRDQLVAVDLRSGRQRILYRTPENFTGGSLSVTADGRYVCTAIRQRVAFENQLDLAHGYVGFRELFEAHPYTQILKIAVDGGLAEVVHEEHNWITHVNTSPGLPTILTFCHEGPWYLVQQRIWGLDLSRPGQPWSIRPQKPGECVGHEYWMADGEHLGYHGWVEGDMSRTIFGSIRYDNQDHIEVPFPFNSHHFHSNTLDLIVGDGDARRRVPYVLLWRFDGRGFQGPRVLCVHRCSRHIQRSHVHPRFSPDGSQVLFTSDSSGYANVYLAEVPEFESLPLLEKLEQTPRD